MLMILVGTFYLMFFVVIKEPQNLGLPRASIHCIEECCVKSQVACLCCLHINVVYTRNIVILLQNHPYIWDTLLEKNKKTAHHLLAILCSIAAITQHELYQERSVQVLSLLPAVGCAPSLLTTVLWWSIALRATSTISSAQRWRFSRLKWCAGPDR